MCSDLPKLSEETAEEVRTEFERLERELLEQTYYAVGRCITEWSASEAALVHIAAILLRTAPEKAGLVLYSINNFHAWLSIIEELFGIDSQYLPLRSDWLEISRLLKKLNDTRVRLAHHALEPGLGFEHFVTNGGGRDGISSIYPTLRPDAIDYRAKSKKHLPLGLRELTTFLAELNIARGKLMELMDRITPTLLVPAQEIAAKLKKHASD